MFGGSRSHRKQRGSMLCVGDPPLGSSKHLMRGGDWRIIKGRMGAAGGGAAFGLGGGLTDEEIVGGSFLWNLYVIIQLAANHSSRGAGKQS